MAEPTISPTWLFNSLAFQFPGFSLVVLQMGEVLNPVGSVHNTLAFRIIVLMTKYQTLYGNLGSNERILRCMVGFEDHATNGQVECTCGLELGDLSKLCLEAHHVVWTASQPGHLGA